MKNAKTRTRHVTRGMSSVDPNVAGFATVVSRRKRVAKFHSSVPLASSSTARAAVAVDGARGSDSICNRMSVAIEGSGCASSRRDGIDEANAGRVSLHRRDERGEERRTDDRFDFRHFLRDTLNFGYHFGRKLRSACGIGDGES